MKVPSFPDDVAMALIEEELGQPWHEIYSELSSSPIAAGNLITYALSNLISETVGASSLRDAKNIWLYIVEWLYDSLACHPYI